MPTIPFMDIIQALTVLKGKVLDAANFELLKSAYELQNENIEQYKNNNTALKENNDLLKEKISGLKEENDNLKKRVKIIEDDLRGRENADSFQKISEFAEAILRKCIKDDKSDFTDEKMLASLPFSRLQAEAGLDELIRFKFVGHGSASMVGGAATYYLTSEGTKLALKISSKEKVG